MIGRWCTKIKKERHKQINERCYARTHSNTCTRAEQLSNYIVLHRHIKANILVLKLVFISVNESYSEHFASAYTCILEHTQTETHKEKRKKERNRDGHEKYPCTILVYWFFIYFFRWRRLLNTAIRIISIVAMCTCVNAHEENAFVWVSVYSRTFSLHIFNSFFFRSIPFKFRPLCT